MFYLSEKTFMDIYAYENVMSDGNRNPYRRDQSVLQSIKISYIIIVFCVHAF